MSKIKMTAAFEPCDEGGYIAYIEEIRGKCYSDNTT